jgi:hypothetical protein
MSKKQTRRSISVRGTTYARLRDYCAGADLSMSDFVEQRIADFFAEQAASGKVTPRVVAAPAPKPPVVVKPVAAIVERPAARVAPPRTEPLPIRPVPVKSTVSVKPALPTAALRVTAPAPMPEKPAAVAPVAARPSMGRPAPTPASQVLKVRSASTEREVDYRAIRF